MDSSEISDNLGIAQFNDVTFSYSKKVSEVTLKKLFINRNEVKNKNVFTNLSFSIEKSKRYALIGHNGAGKSSIALMIMNKIFPDSGNIILRGRAFAIFSDSDNLFVNIKIIDVVKFSLEILWPQFNAFEITALTQEILIFCELDKLQENSIETLSKGMRQKLLLSIYTAKEVDLLILDESIAGVEESFYPKFRNRLDRCLGNHGTLLLIDHNKSTRDYFCQDFMSIEKNGELKLNVH